METIFQAEKTDGKASTIGVYVECLRNSQEDNVGGEKLFRGIIVKEEIREVTRS